MAFKCWFKPFTKKPESVGAKKKKKRFTEQCDTFSKWDNNNIGNIESLKLKLNVTDSIAIVNCTIRSLHKLILRWKNISRIYCVQKKDGTMRLCIAYGELNKKIHPDWMPIPRIQDILDNPGDQEYFTTLDMSKTYHQGSMDKDSCNLTAFTTPWVKDTFRTFHRTLTFPNIYEPMSIRIKRQCMYAILGECSLFQKIFWQPPRQFEDSCLTINKSWSQTKSSRKRVDI